MGAIITEKDSNVKPKNPLTPYYLFDGIRVLSQLYILVFHYLALIFCDNQDISYPLRYALSFLVRAVFVFFFAISGISTAKWFVQNWKKTSSASSLIARFYFERLAMIVPFYYIFLFFYYLFLVVKGNSVILDNFTSALIPNLFFVSNFFGTEKIVSLTRSGISSRFFCQPFTYFPQVMVSRNGQGG